MAPRTIRQRGEPFPNVALKRTFRLHTQHEETQPQGGVDWGQHKHQRFPWLHPTKSVTGALDPNKIYLKQQTASGYRDVEVQAQGYDRHLYINNEESIILTQEQLDEIRAAYPNLNLPDLMYNTPQNTRKIEAIRKPSELDDVLLNNVDSYRIVASDSVAKTITVTGQNWYANRPSTIQTGANTPLYAHAAYQGINCYMRDGLTSDPEVLYSRNKQYDYAWIEVGGAKYKIDQITDLVTENVSTSQDLGILIGGLAEGSTVTIEVRQITEGGEYSDAISDSFTLTGAPGSTDARVYSDSVGSESVIGQAPPARGAGTINAPTNLRIYPVSRSVCNVMFRKASSNTAYELVVNGVVYAHVLSEESMLSAPDRISDPTRYRAKSLHVLHFVDDGGYDAPALVDPGNLFYYGYVTLFRRPTWITTMAATTGVFHQKDGVWRLRMRISKHMLQFISAFLWGGYSEVNFNRYDSEDKEDEYDLFEDPAGISVFHNLHKPSGGMYDYAARNGETPVMNDGYPEWRDDTSMQHQVLIDPSHEHYVDSTVEIDILYVIWPENNEARKPGNRVEVYVRTADGEWRFTCGSVTSTAARNGKLDKLCAFLCCPVDGNFVASMQEVFAPGKGHTENGDKITFEIMDFECYQLVGHEAGGASLPDDDGYYPQPMLPTPCMYPQASGTGIVTEGEYDLFGTGTIPDGGTDTGSGGDDGGDSSESSASSVRISNPNYEGDVVLPKGKVNKPAGDDTYQPILARADGSRVYVRRARLEP